MDDFLERDPDLETLDLPIDLPDQLASYDVTEFLPKLPTLPVLPSSVYQPGQLSLSEIFSSQTLLDDVLHKGSSKELDALNTFLLSDSNGAIRIVVYDSLSIGDIVPPGFSPQRQTKISHMKHASHPLAQSHVLVSQIKEGDSSSVALVPISLRFLKNSGRNIHFIDYKTAQLETLVQYVGESILAIEHTWRHAHEYPSRSLANISEDLRDKDEPDILASLYQLCAAGYCTETLKDWIVDQLNERGHKRWDQAVTQGYVRTLELLQENLFPALDRCSIVLSNLQGLAEYYEDSPAFDVPIASFTHIQDIIRCLRLIGHSMLLLASQDQIRFAAFSRWLRYQIDVQGADPNTAAGEEMLERDSGVDPHLVLKYIQQSLLNSKMNDFLGRPDPDGKEHKTSDLYDDVVKALDAFKANESFQPSLIKFSHHFQDWSRHNRKLIEDITGWQRANTWIPGSLTLVRNVQVSHCDVRMIAETTSDAMWTYVAMSTEADTINLHRVKHADLFEDIQDSIMQSEAVALHLQGQRVLDLKFVDDNQLFALVKGDTDSCLISIPLSSNFAFQFDNVKIRMLSSIAQNLYLDDPKTITIDDEVIEAWIRCRFWQTNPFQPAYLEVNGRKNRRVCVLTTEDGKQMQVRDMDSEGDEDL